MRGELPFDTAGRARFAAALNRVALVVYQGPHGLDLEERAHIFLPSATHAEQDGTFVNETGYAQAAYAAVPAMGQALADWDVLSRIARAADRPLSFDSFDALHATLAATIAAE
jgi:NADH dehydrogenase/NADH:ubiquinone oxidoreductase subunit G